MYRPPGGMLDELFSKAMPEKKTPMHRQIPWSTLLMITLSAQY
jgi:hypothetical protein